MKNIVWRWEYGVYVPFCPYCDEPACEHDGCVFCAKPYQWVNGEIQPTRVSKGDYTVVQSTNNHISLYKNGELVQHAQQDQKKTEEELLEYIGFYENFDKILEGASEEG